MTKKKRSIGRNVKIELREFKNLIPDAPGREHEEEMGRIMDTNMVGNRDIQNREERRCVNIITEKNIRSERQISTMELRKVAEKKCTYFKISAWNVGSISGKKNKIVEELKA